MIFANYIIGIIIGILLCLVWVKILHKRDAGTVQFDIYNEDCPVIVRFNKDIGYLMDQKELLLKVEVINTVKQDSTNIIYNSFNDRN